MPRADPCRRMLSCTTCGAASAGGAFCAACGARLPDPGHPVPAPRAAPGARAALPERPAGVTLVAVGFFALAAGAAVVALFMALMGPVAHEVVRPWFGVFAAFAAALVAFVAILALLFAAFTGAIGYGLLRGHAWAWGASLVVAGLAVLSNLARLAEAEPGGVLGALVWGGLVYYFLRPEVRAWFGRPARGA